jgi:hypothetical protein
MSRSYVRGQSIPLPNLFESEVQIQARIAGQSTYLKLAHCKDIKNMGEKELQSVEKFAVGPTDRSSFDTDTHLSSHESVCHSTESPSQPRTLIGFFSFVSVPL